MTSDRTFGERMGLATAHETLVLNKLTAAGWDATPFGQGQLTKPMRDHLRHYRSGTETKHPTYLRWLPDIIAAVRINNHTVVRLVDAKSEREHTGKHSVEATALPAGQEFQSAFQIPLWYIFPDTGCINIDTLAASTEKKFMLRVDLGRTDFWLFPGTICTPFSTAFCIDSLAELAAAEQSPQPPHNSCDCEGHMGFHIDCDENGVPCHCQPKAVA